jgi:hypothetical protein
MKIARKIAVLLLFFGSMTALRADTPLLPGGTSGNGRSVELQMKAAEVTRQIQADYRYTLSLQSQARRQKDVIKLNCVNDKLIQIKAEMNIGESANSQLEVAVSTNSGDRQTAFTELQAAGNSVRDLRQQAAACLGEAELTKQESGGTYTHPNFPDDPTIIPFDVYTEPPVYASPFN